MIGPFSGCYPSVRHKLERGVGSCSHTAASDLHKETPVITNRCHITFSIIVMKWIETPRDSVIEVHAQGCIAQLPVVSGEGKLCTGNELWLAEFFLIIASKSIMCAPYQIITGPPLLTFNLLPRTVWLGKLNPVIYFLNCVSVNFIQVFITGQRKTSRRNSSLKSTVIHELVER